MPSTEVEARSYAKRFCPDIDKIKDHFQIKNGYNNKHERISFSVKLTNFPGLLPLTDKSLSIIGSIYGSIGTLSIYSSIFNL